MAERGDRAGLALEAGAPVGIGRNTLRQDLDRDVAAEPRVARAVDLAHPSGPNEADDFVRTEADARRHWHGYVVSTGIIAPNRSPASQPAPH